MPIATDDRVALLRRVPGLGEASPAELQELLGVALEMTFSAGAIVIAEGELDRALYVIVSGQAEITTAAGGAPVLNGLLEGGDVVGELAFVSEQGRRTATVVALTELRVLSLDAPVLERFLVAQPGRLGALSEHAEALRTANFIRRVGVFGTLDAEQRRRLAARVTKREIERGEVIVRQDDAGESCFMLRSGEAEVATEDAQGERILGVLRAGALFGEGAVLTGGRRTATVRALDTCEVLELARDDLVDVLESDADAAQEITYLFRLRQRPRRADSVEVHRHVSEDGELLTTLRNPDALTYFRLSERGRFVWDRLDGTRSLRDLTIDYFEAFASFDPYTVADVVVALGRAQMLDDDRVASTDAYKRNSPFSEVALTTRKLLLWRYDIPSPDRFVGALYRRGGRVLFTRPGLAIVRVLALIAVAAFAADLVAGHGLDHQDGRFALFVIPGFWLALLVHEAGHALAVKAHGRHIPAVGIGWYYLSPIAYVDTSDMWLADRRARVAVSLAGPIATLLVAGPVALAALFTSDPQTSAILWAIALPIYASVFINLCPLLEYDGYYVLSDLADRPNLRTETLEWIRTGRAGTGRGRSKLRGHRLEKLYAGASVLYLVLASVVVVFIYRVVLEHWLDALLPASATAPAAWAIVLLNVSLVVILLVDSIRRAE